MDGSLAPDRTPRRPASAAERQRAYRARKRCGIRVVGIELDAAEIDEWIERAIEAGVIEPWEASDPARLAEALGPYVTLRSP